MQVEINNQDSILLPALGHIIFGSDQKCDVVLSGSSELPEKACSIINDNAACILEVFQGESVLINNLPVKEMAILHPGDKIFIHDQVLKIVDENNLPTICTTPYKINNKADEDDQLVTSVTGLRSFNKSGFGELALIGNKNSYTHKPIDEKDIPFSVSFLADKLTLLCKKNESININGNKAEFVVLKNGDFISTNSAKYCVESPGTSSFSKYSPSHPRNIQLSEEYIIDIKNKDDSISFFKKNLWWVSLVVGLIIVAAVLYYLKNH